MRSERSREAWYKSRRAGHEKRTLSKRKTENFALTLFSPFRFQISASRFNLLHVLETTGIDSTGHTSYAINIHRQS